MEQEKYDEHVAALKSGKIVFIGGRSALTAEQLHFAIRATGDTVPGEPDALDHSPEAAEEDALEHKELADLKDLAASVGLTVKDTDTKEYLIESIRAIQADMQAKP